MSNIHTVKLPKKNEVDFYFGIFDLHITRAHWPTVNILKQHAKLIPRGQRRLIIGGDALEAEHLMLKGGEATKAFKNISTIENYLIPESEYEFGLMNEFLDEMQKIFDYIYWLDGNHDARHQYMREKYCPAPYKHNFDVEKQLRLRQRGIPYLPYQDYLDIGNKPGGPTITHGDRHGLNCTRQMLQRVGGTRTIFFGHIHSHQAFSQFSRGELVRSVSVPTAGDINPGYIKNRETNWSNGYLTLQVRHDGRFNYQINEVFGDKMVDSRGKVFDGS